ncbi:MAG: hypothetical protein K0U79_09900 [Gammaproteobacteria bacterium]|nr:hypothetical protein [Gammaproteobacteria bacterium]
MEPERKFVIYNGARMIEGWPEKIEQAQTEALVFIAGTEHERVRYGDEEEDWGAGKRPCHDCAVQNGQFHVPGCDVERCPVCGGQAINCDCDYVEEDESEA